LAEALSHYPYLLRFQALECLCPLNNIRLLPQPGGTALQCLNTQFADPAACGTCLRQRGHLSGGLHQAERALCGVGTAEYHERLLRVTRNAHAVLAVNPEMAELLKPFSDRVHVVP